MAAEAELHSVREGEGPPVVLVHGFTQTAESWQPISHRLATEHQVICVDAPGHGGSSDVRANLWDGARLLGRAGGAAGYVGYSMGARLCLHLALADPNLVRALVLVGATAGLDEAADRKARRDADEALAQSLENDGLEPFLRQWLRSPLFAGLTTESAGMPARMRNTVAGLASSLRLAGTGTQHPPLWDRLSELTMPVLVVAGERDDKFRALGERLAASIGSNARIAVVPDAGHAAHLEAPEAFIHLLRPFLRATT